MRRFLVALFAAGSFGIAIPAMGQPTSTPVAPAPSALDQAKAALRQGKPDAALSLVGPIIAKAEASDAKDADAMCPGAAAAFLTAFMAKESKLNVVVSVENDWCEAMLVEGYALGELKRFDEAAERLGKLVKHDGSNANYLAEYGFALRSAGRVDQAMSAYKQAKAAASRYSDKSAQRHWRAVALRGIGYIEFDRQNWKAAEKAYKDSLRDEPGNQIALSELELIKQKLAN